MKGREEGPPTRNRATAVPRMKPAITSEQWFRYSETRLRPVRKAVQRVPKHSTGLASRLLLVLIVLVMYICSGRETSELQAVLSCCIHMKALMCQVRNRR